MVEIFVGPFRFKDAVIVVSGMDVLLIRRSAQPNTEYSWLPPTGPRTSTRLTVPSPLKYLDIAAQSQCTQRLCPKRLSDELTTGKSTTTNNVWGSGELTTVRMLYLNRDVDAQYHCRLGAPTMRGFSANRHSRQR